MSPPLLLKGFSGDGEVVPGFGKVVSDRWFGWRWKIREASRACRGQFFRKKFKFQPAFISHGALGNTFLMSPSASRDPLKLSSHIWKMEGMVINDVSRMSTGL